MQYIVVNIFIFYLKLLSNDLLKGTSKVLNNSFYMFSLTPPNPPLKL